MNARNAASGALFLLAAVALVLTLFPGLLVGDPGPYQRATVVAYDDNGTRLAAVEVRIADTYEKQYVGLGETESLAPDEGMLFVHDREKRHTYVMRGMSFPLDIVFLDANGTVTRIYHADEDAKRDFTGYGKYVLEVNRGWAERVGLDVGDTVEIPERVQAE